MMSNQDIVSSEQLKTRVITMLLSSVEEKIKAVGTRLQQFNQAITNWRNLKNQLNGRDNSNRQNQEQLQKKSSEVEAILDEIVDTKNIILRQLYILKQNGCDSLRYNFDSVGLPEKLKQIVTEIGNLKIDGLYINLRYGEEYKSALKNFFTNIQHIDDIPLEYVNSIAMSKSNYEKGEFDPNKMPPGLVNIGATCYMDATLQEFYNVSGLREYFEYGPLKDKYNKRVYNLVKYYHDNNKVPKFKNTINDLWNRVCTAAKSDKNAEIKLDESDMDKLEKFCIERMENINNNLTLTACKVKKKEYDQIMGGWTYVDTNENGWVESLSDEQKKELRLMSYCFVDNKRQVKTDLYGNRSESYYSFVDNGQYYTFAEMLKIKIKAKQRGTKSMDKDVLENNEDMHNMAYEFYLFIKNLNNAKKDYSPKRFKESLSISNTLFKGINANDPRDLIIFLLENINREISEPKKPTDQNNDYIDGRNFENVFKCFLERFLKENHSWISDKFYGINNTTTQCQSCETLSYSVEPFNIFIFLLDEVRKFKQYPESITDNQGNMSAPTVTLQECFEYHYKQSRMTGVDLMYCNYCSEQNGGQSRLINHTTKLLTLPDKLVINLNRGKGNCFKVNIDFPEYFDHFDLDFVFPCSNQSQKFIFKKFSSTINHVGGSDMSGHFINIGRNAKNGLIYKYNDAIVLSDNFESAKKLGVPYVLTYETMSPEEMLAYVLSKVKNPIYSKAINDKFYSFKKDSNQRQRFAYLLMSAAVGRSDLEAADNLSDLICAVHDVIKGENNFIDNYMNDYKALINKMAMWVNYLQKAALYWDCKCVSYVQILDNNRWQLINNYTMDGLIYEANTHMPQAPGFASHCATILLNQTFRYKVNLRDIVSKINQENKWNIICEEDVFANTSQGQQNQVIQNNSNKSDMMDYNQIDQSNNNQNEINNNKGNAPGIEINNKANTTLDKGNEINEIKVKGNNNLNNNKDNNNEVKAKPTVIKKKTSKEPKQKKQNEEERKKRQK